MNIYKRIVRLSSVIYIQILIKIAYKKNTKILWSVETYLVAAIIIKLLCNTTYWPYTVLKLVHSIFSRNIY